MPGGKARAQDLIDSHGDFHQGVTIIYISHRFEELYEFCHRVSVLRDGALVDTKERNLVNIITAASITTVLAVGQFSVIVTGGIDLSVGALAALATVMSAILLANHQLAAVASFITPFNLWDSRAHQWGTR